jgi:HEAT repeat protein
VIEALFVLFPYVILAVGAPFVIRAERRRRKERMDTLQWVAERLSLQEVDIRAPAMGTARLVARSGRHRIHIGHAMQANQKVPLTIVTVEGNSGITLKPEPANPLTKAIGEREIELGDETFDAAVWVLGAPERVRAVLDAETRGVVLRMLTGTLVVPGRRPIPVPAGVTLDHGHLRAAFPDRASPTAVEIADALGALLALAPRFERPTNVAARLASTIAVEPEWRVRLQALQLLSTSYPSHPSTAEALRAALTDERAEVRLHAAIALGEEGRSALIDLARHEQVEDAIAAQAVGALGNSMPMDVGVQVLRHALRTRRLHTCVACAETVEPLGAPEARELLGKILERERGELAVAAAKALGRAASGAPGVEESLVGALGHDDRDVRIAAIEALGHVGTVAAVLPIQDAATGPRTDTDVRRAARQAVAEIQSRLPGASPGQLSIAGDEGGQLSLADDDPRGRVSLPS